MVPCAAVLGLFVLSWGQCFEVPSMLLMGEKKGIVLVKTCTVRSLVEQLEEENLEELTRPALSGKRPLRWRYCVCPQSLSFRTSDGRGQVGSLLTEVHC